MVSNLLRGFASAFFDLRHASQEATIGLKILGMKEIDAAIIARLKNLSRDFLELLISYVSTCFCMSFHKEPGQFIRLVFLIQYHPLFLALYTIFSYPLRPTPYLLHLFIY